MDLRQYQILIVNLDPTVGSEIKKTRPCIIISPDEMNKSLKTVVIAPISSTYKPYPTRIAISQNKTSGWIAIYQIRSIDKQRVVGIVGQVSESDVEAVKAIMQQTYVD